MKYSLYINRILIIILPLLPLFLIGLWLFYTSEETEHYVSLMMLLLILWILIRSILFSVLVAILHLNNETIPYKIWFIISIIVMVIIEFILAVIDAGFSTVPILGIFLILIDIISIIITTILTGIYFTGSKIDTDQDIKNVVITV